LQQIYQIIVVIVHNTSEYFGEPLTIKQNLFMVLIYYYPLFLYYLIFIFIINIEFLFRFVVNRVCFAVIVGNSIMVWFVDFWSCDL